ncbi:hypothetical protein [Oscillatoria acuminata]|nr:hypothetical protein [Oscillatoria acuminata]
MGELVKRFLEVLDSFPHGTSKSRSPGNTRRFGDRQIGLFGAQF